jgi:hypothetical protein
VATTPLHKLDGHDFPLGHHTAESLKVLVYRDWTWDGVCGGVILQGLMSFFVARGVVWWAMGKTILCLLITTHDRFSSSIERPNLFTKLQPIVNGHH